MITDYGGQDVRPDQWDMKLQELFRKSRALMFFIAEKDYTDAVSLRRRASMFNLFLEYWMASNPGIKHIPIALVLTKCDLLLQDSLTSLPRSTLIGDDFKPATVEMVFNERIKTKAKLSFNMPYDRFCDLIFNDKSNNSHPLLQDIIQLLMDNFTQFFSRMLDLTYNYQIFLTSSLPPQFKGDTKYPFGVREPISWVASVLEKIHIVETLEKFTVEEELLNNEIKAMSEDITKMYQLNTEIEKLEKDYYEIIHTRNPIRLMLGSITKDDILRQKSTGETQLEKYFQRYGQKVDQQNRKATIKNVEQMVKDKESTIVSLNDKRRHFENRKKALQI